MEENVIFNKKSSYSSDENVLTASYIGTQDQEVPDLNLEVHSLAGSQENLGLFLPDARIDLPPATYSFDVGINDLNYEFQFTVGETETNRDVQERLVRLINNSGIGIRADIAESDGRTSLRLTSDATGLAPGKKQLFTVSDNKSSKRTGTVNYFGLDYVSREASNARFSINGEERSSTSNRFTIGKMFDVQLKGLTQEGDSVQIGLKTDVESLADNVSHLVGGYNDFVNTAASYMSTQSKSGQLVNEMRGIVGLYGSDLEAIGINLREDGTLNLNRDVLHQAVLQSDDITETFGSLKNLSGSLIRKSNQVALNPMDYVQKTVVAYKNPGHNFVSPYNSSAYSGMLFNSYC